MLIHKIKNLSFVLCVLAFMAVTSQLVLAVGPKKAKEFDLTIVNNTKNLDLEVESLSEKYRPDPKPIIKRGTKETFAMPLGSTTPHELIRLVDPIKGAGNKSWMQKLSGGGHGTGISFIKNKINKVTLMEFTEKNSKSDNPQPEITYDLNAEFIPDGEDSYKVIFTGGPTE